MTDRAAGAGGAGPRYGVIVGHGRSGSNWVLSILNASPAVHARNEPHLLAGSPYGALPDPAAMAVEPQAVAQAWDAFAAWACARDGARDPRTFVAKDFHRRWASRTGASNWPYRPRIRRALGVAVPSLRQPEWRPPGWLVDRAGHAAAVHVLKVNDCRFWHAAWVLRERPEVPVLHLVRHPGGYLRSAWSRFFGRLDDEARWREEAVYRGALAASLAVAPRWRGRVGDVARLPLDEAVAWFWRVNNEEIHLAGQGRPGYRMVRYEDLVDAPLQLAPELFAHMGVPWTAGTEAVVRDGLDRSVWGAVTAPRGDLAAGWRDRLDERQLSLVERVLADGPVASWW